MNLILKSKRKIFKIKKSCLSKYRKRMEKINTRTKKTWFKKKWENME